MAYDTKLIVQLALGEIRRAPGRQVHEIAAMCGVSGRTLERAFKRQKAGVLRDARLAALRSTLSLLMTAPPARSIKEVSAALGFASSQSFARWAKRENGVIPTALRARLCEQLALETARAQVETRAEGGGVPPVVRRADALAADPQARRRARARGGDR